MSLLSRKQFLKVLVTVSAAAAVGCGDDESGTGSTGGAGGTGSGGDATGGSNTGASSTGGSNTGGTGQGGSSTGGGGGGNVPNCADGALVEISANHGVPHELVINGADLELAGDVPFGLGQGGSPTHQHTFTLTEADKQTLFSTGSVTMTTSTDSGHSHDVTFSCTS